MDAQMKKGVLELCLLYIISTRKTYGYELLTEMQAAFPDVKESTIYAVLRRLQADQYVEAVLGDASQGPVRKYLHITSKGREALLQGIESWQALIMAVTKIGISF